jgi:HlyD family secretion protein
MKSIYTLVALAVAIAIGWSIYRSTMEGAPVEVAEVGYGPIRQFVDEEAKTRLPRTYLITMPYNGRIEAIDLVEGTQVSAGQVVARIVPADLDLELKTAQAAVERLKASIEESDDASVERTGLAQAINYVKSMDLTVEAAEKRVESGQARYEFAKKNLARVRSLAERNLKAEEELNRAEVELVESDVDYQQDILVFRALQAIQAATALLPTSIQQYIGRKDLSTAVLRKELSQAQYELQQVETNTQRGTMESPVDGVVLDRPITNERHLTAGAVLLEIGRLDDLEVESEILTQDVVDVAIGDDVEVYGPAVGKTPARGKVARVYPAGFTKVSSLGVEQQRVNVLVHFLPEDLRRLRQDRNIGVGYRVNVRIFTDTRDQARLIPRSALFRGAAGDWQVFAVRGGVARLVPIEIGLINDELVEVASGLDETDQVILAPETNLTDGTRVSPIVTRPAESMQ